MLFLGPVPLVRERSRVRPVKEEKPYRYRRPPASPRSRSSSGVRVSLPRLLRCRGWRLVGPGPSRPPSVRKSVFSSDPMRRASPPARPDSPMRVASAGCPSPRPVFGGGKNPSVCVCRPLRPAPPRSESGEEPRGARERVVTPACRPCRSLGRVTRGGERRGRVRARPSAAGPRFPRSAPPRVRARLGRGAEPSGKRAGLGGGGLPGPTRPPSVPAASGPSRASPSLPFPRPRPRRARRVRASLVLCAVWRSPRSPLPGSVPTVGEQRVDPSLLGVGDPVLALRGRDHSLGCGLWRERRSVVSRRVAGRVGARHRRRAFLRRRRARLSRRWVRARGCERQASRVSGASRGKEA